MNQDGGLLIMPGSLSLDVSNIRDELTRYVGENWNAIVDHEVDGKASMRKLYGTVSDEDDLDDDEESDSDE